MNDILHQFHLRASPTQIYHALTDRKGLSHWWTRNVNAEPIVNSIAEFTFEHGNVVYRMKVVKLIPGRSVVWHCISGHPEWEGTQISFDIEPHKDSSMINFAHRGWKRTTGIYARCNFDWAKYLVSLRNYLEKGKGFPAR